MSIHTNHIADIACIARLAPITSIARFDPGHHPNGIDPKAVRFRHRENPLSCAFYARSVNDRNDPTHACILIRMIQLS
jgi:hypothetical protein